MLRAGTTEFLALCASRRASAGPAADQAWIETLFGHIKTEWPHSRSRPQHAASRARHRPTRLQHPPPHASLGTSPPTTNTKAEATPSARPAKTAQTGASPASPTIMNTPAHAAIKPPRTFTQKHLSTAPDAPDRSRSVSSAAAAHQQPRQHLATRAARRRPDAPWSASKPNRSKPASNNPAADPSSKTASNPSIPRYPAHRKCLLTWPPLSLAAFSCQGLSDAPTPTTSPHRWIQA